MDLMGHRMGYNVDFIVIFIILCASHLLRSSVYAHFILQLFHCKELATSNGFIYQVPLDLIPGGNLKDCEHGWYFPNGTLLVDSTIPGENLGFVVRVNPENLTVKTCVNLQWQLDCDNIKFYRIVNYTERLITPTTLPENNTSPGNKEVCPVFPVSCQRCVYRQSVFPASPLVCAFGHPQCLSSHLPQRIISSTELHSLLINYPFMLNCWNKHR
ncbi:uncharacterized protein LOC130243096 [Danio aesculapii]|uniref:uncharacterized protein LOC130243096 n=1 Tax=Danio aesculapii TaxID=1142201 RepID=UPI0024BF5923|nr:uncharacterized protein LOC130243096 [Danio aesculapii]